MESTALGFLELQSIAKGFFLADVVVKKAAVSILAAEATSNGKFVLLFSGDIASVEESYRAGCDHAGDAMVRNIMIPALDPQITPFLESGWKTGWTRIRRPVVDSVAVLESKSMADTVLSCDSALKIAPVILGRFHLGTGIGGHGYYVISGVQSDVEVAAERGAEILKTSGSLVSVEVIARPQEEALALF